MTLKNLNQGHRSRSSTQPVLDGLLRQVRKAGSRASASYLKLVVSFPIRPLGSHQELDEAIGILDGLLSRKKPLDVQEQGYFDSLTNEIRRYEEAHIPMQTVSGVEMLRHLIEAHDMTLSDVSKGAGISISTVSSILTGKRQLNKNHIEKLARLFRVSPAVFLE